MRKYSLILLALASALALAATCMFSFRAKRVRIPDQWIGIFDSDYDLVADRTGLTLLRGTPEGDGSLVTSVSWWIIELVEGALIALAIIMMLARSNKGQRRGFDIA